MLLALQLNNLLEDTVPPVFAGTIPDIEWNQNTGAHLYDLGGYFTGATSFSIAPAVETGWAFDTGNGELVIDTDAAGVFGPYVITGTNLAGTDDSNGFSVTVNEVVAQQSPSGGWLTFINTYEQQAERRRREARKRKELEEETEQIQDATDRQIAQLLREQEAKDAKRADLERLAALAKANADIESARRYSERVARAYEAALKSESIKALDRLDKELRKAREEEEALLLSLLFLDE